MLREAKSGEVRDPGKPRVSVSFVPDSRVSVWTCRHGYVHAYQGLRHAQTQVRPTAARPWRPDGNWPWVWGQETLLALGRVTQSLLSSFPTL